jgi:hypothetical protein
MAVLMVLNVVLSCVPTAVIAPMITTEDQSGDQPILDGGSAGFILKERQQVPKRERALISARTCTVRCLASVRFPTLLRAIPE